MSFHTGSGASVRIGKETAFGTAAAADTLLDITSESIQVSVEKGDEGSLLASKTPQSRDLMSIKAGGSVSAILRPESAGLLMHAALGGFDMVVANDGKQTHTLHLCDTREELPSLTVIVDRIAAVKKYTGCTVSSLSIEAAAGDYVKCTLELKGVKEEAGTITSPVTSFVIPSYRCTSAYLKFNGEEYDITSASFKLDNALEEAPQTYKSGLFAGQPKHGRRSVTISFDVPYSEEIETIKSEYLLSEATASIELMFASSNPDYTMKISMPHVSLSSVGGNVGGTGIISSSLEGEALSVGSEDPLEVVITDKTATAYGG